MRTGRAVTFLLALLGLLAAGCLDNPERRVNLPAAPGAATLTIPSTDDVTLGARLWMVDPDRLVIYLHEYRDDQSSWWSQAGDSLTLPASRLTFDFRGHGESSGNAHDFSGMVDDARSVIEFSRARGYHDIVLVGSGMGGTIAIIAGAEEDVDGVVGLSTPTDFDELSAVDAAKTLGNRLSLVATEGDLSAVYSMGVFRQAAHLDAARAQVYPGRSHGVDMLFGRAGAEVRAYFKRVVASYWVEARAPSASALPVYS